MTLFNFVPSGTILPFGGVTAPAGWLLCDGSAVSRAVYANLYSAIGGVWGSGDGSSTFHLPDLRGRFIRGRDGGVARDPDRTTRTAANSGGNTGDNVGSVQDNATAKNGLSASSGTHSADHAHYTTTGGVSANHYHGIGGDGYHNHGIRLEWGTGSVNSGPPGQYNQVTNNTAYGFHYNPQVSGEGWHAHSGGTGWISSDHSHGGWSGGVNTNHTHGITVGNGDNETRPKNANVNYIIKI